MLTALVDEGLTLVGRRFGEAIDLSLPADENLRRLCDAYCRFYWEDPHHPQRATRVHRPIKELLRTNTALLIRGLSAKNHE